MTDFFSLLSSPDFCDKKRSVMNHIRVLLNCRQGSLSHKPEYGLPDYGAHPANRSAKHYFIDAIEDVLKTYEPRIQSLNIQDDNVEQTDCILQLSFTIQLKKECIQFKSRLLNSGEMVISDSD